MVYESRVVYESRQKVSQMLPVPGKKVFSREKTGNISSVGTARTARTRSTKKNSICAVYSAYDVCFDQVCTVSIISWPLFLHNILTDGATSRSWSKLLSAGTTGVLTVLTSVTGSIPHVCTAATACTRGSVLLILPVLAVFGPSALLMLPVLAVFRPPVLQRSQN